MLERNGATTMVFIGARADHIGFGFAERIFRSFGELHRERQPQHGERPPPDNTCSGRIYNVMSNPQRLQKRPKNPHSTLTVTVLSVLFFGNRCRADGINLTTTVSVGANFLNVKAGQIGYGHISTTKGDADRTDCRIYNVMPGENF
jgi:hypothetical protein